MPDIQMCAGSVSADGHVCAKRNDCYRYTAKPNRFNQAYGNPAPDYHYLTGCSFFIENKQYGDLEQKPAPPHLEPVEPVKPCNPCRNCGMCK